MLSESAIASLTPSLATAEGVRMLRLVGGITTRSTVVKSVCPKTTDAVPTHAGHLRVASNMSVGLGIIEDRFV